MLSNIEAKLEELRKASMNEINRLEAIMETDDGVKLGRFNAFEIHILSQLNEA